MLLLDATSSHTCFGIGKGVALRKLSSDANFTITAKVFSNDASLDDIVLAGEMALWCLYGSSSSEGSDAVRCRHFTEKVTRRTTNVHLHSLPPTAAAAVYHSVRVYFYVPEWITGWGSQTNWTQKNGDGSKHGVDMNHEQQIFHLQEARAGVFRCKRRIQMN